jgi:hypothetical protein
MNGNNSISDEIVKSKIRRALLSGPDSITSEATVAEMDTQGTMTVLRPGTNQWVCLSGNENIIAQADMCADPMGMRWHLDIVARKPKPTNTEPGLIYMLNGATQRSYTPIPRGSGLRRRPAPLRAPRGVSSPGRGPAPPNGGKIVMSSDWRNGSSAPRAHVEDRCSSCGPL